MPWSILAALLGSIPGCRGVRDPSRGAEGSGILLPGMQSAAVCRAGLAARLFSGQLFLLKRQLEKLKPLIFENQLENITVTQN